MQWVMIALAIFLGGAFGSMASSFWVGLLMTVLLASGPGISLIMQSRARRATTIKITPQQASQVPRNLRDLFPPKWTYKGETTEVAVRGVDGKQTAYEWSFVPMLANNGVTLSVVLIRQRDNEAYLACWLTQWSIHKGGVLVPGLLTALSQKRVVEAWATSEAPATSGETAPARR